MPPRRPGRRVGATACAGLFAVGLACGRNPAPGGGHASAPAAAPPVAETPAAEGIVYLAGADPLTILMLRPDTGASQRLSGDLSGELGRLAGARVEVRGVPDTRGPGAGIAVGSYTILAIDGRRPIVGVLEATNGAVRLVGQDTLALADPDGRLARQGGAKVWVLTDAAASPAAVQSYGVLREAGR